MADVLTESGLVAGEAVRGDDLDAIAPGFRTVRESPLECLLRAALDHVQQPGGTGAGVRAGQIDDDGDVLVATTRMPPNMLIYPDDVHAVEPGGVVDQDTLALRSAVTFADSTMGLSLQGI